MIATRLLTRALKPSHIYPQLSQCHSSLNSQLDSHSKISASNSAPTGHQHSGALTLHDSNNSDFFDVPPDHARDHLNLYDPSDFLLYPDFLSHQQQSVMLDFLLAHLDKFNRPRSRRRPAQHSSGVSGTFRDSSEYKFESGHFDQVISGYREVELSKLDLSPEASGASTIADTFARLKALLPAQTAPPLVHILHLAPNGKIDAHVDSPDASGPTIIGLSLGSTRVMRLGHRSAPTETHLKVLLPAGSLYIQRDSVRYTLQHSIRDTDQFKNREIVGSQRLSLMLRDHKTQV